MIDEKINKLPVSKVYVETEDGTPLNFEMTLSLQMLFDDVMTFVSETDF